MLNENYFPVSNCDVMEHRIGLEVNIESELWVLVLPEVEFKWMQYLLNVARK